MPYLLHQFIEKSARATPDKVALVIKDDQLSYAQLQEQMNGFASALHALDVEKSERVAVFLEKRFETVTAVYGTAAAGGVFVPVNPLLKAQQVQYILLDCNVRVLVTSQARLLGLQNVLESCPDLRYVVLVDVEVVESPKIAHVSVLAWADVLANAKRKSVCLIDDDLLSILYTSGSTGQPKGVVLTHRNMVAGAKSVASYLENHSEDRLLAVLPFSFDYGLSQLSTAFLVGAQAVLLNYLFPKDVINALAKYEITGLAAVPPLWIQLAGLDWPESISDHLRYITNSGGAMPKATLKALRKRSPKTKPILMYGLTEAFRSTYLPYEELDARPDSMGKAIPNAEVVVVRPDGSACAPEEPGELVHRGALVAKGYWNDIERTAQRFKSAPNQFGNALLQEMAVWSGDTVRMDKDGFLYFVGRTDEMIKTSGYRVSPTELEETLYSSGMVGEAVALGIPHPKLGQAIVVVVTAPASGEIDIKGLTNYCKQNLPLFMVPVHFAEKAELARNPNGKLDRKVLHAEFEGMYQDD